MKGKRLISLLAAIVMLALLIPSAMAETIENVVVLSAPLVRSSTVRDGMLRVWLKSIGDVTALDVTVTGNYSVNGNTALALSTGDTVNISFDKATGQITMVMNGVTYAMGQEMRLRRHQADGDSAVSIAQASRPKNLYAGDLQLIAVEKTDGYQLYPIVHIYLEYYLYGVVPNEMSSSFPIEALKAQAVTARTYAMRYMDAGGNYDLNDTSSSQVYRGDSGSVTNATKAVDETRGIVINNEGVLSGTYYTASNGGQTESVKNAWGSSSHAYLRVKDDPFDAANTSSIRRRVMVYADFDHASQNTYLSQLLADAAREQLGDTAVIQTIYSVTPHTPKYAQPSRLYTMMDFGVTALADGETKNITLSFSIFNDLEAGLGMSINSGANELWSVEKLEGNFRITAARYGHGIGMSQRGAQQMAKMGYTYDQILGFYYEGCERVQHTFAHTILPAGGTSDVVNTVPPADITPSQQDVATVTLSGTGDAASLRYTASSDGKTLIGISNGAAVTVLAKGAEWTLVRYGEINGYLPTAQLVFPQTPPTTTTETPTTITLWATVTGTDALNLRAGPGFEYEATTQLARDSVLCVLGTSGEWVKVQYGSMVGYVSPDYLTYYNAYPGEISSDSSAMVSLPDAGLTAPLRGTPAMTAAVILEIDHGTQVNVLSNDGSWCLVEVAGVEGYLLTSMLDFSATGVTPTTIPGAAGMTATVNSTASTLNLREGPSTEDSIIAEIPKGTTIIVTDKGEEWCAVKWGNLTGYVMTKYLLFDETETPGPSQSNSPTPTPTPTPTPSSSAAPQGQTAWVLGTVNYVNLRAEASMDAAVITQIPTGDELIVLADLGTFSQVQHGVGTGYVLSKHLTYVKPQQSIGIRYINTDVDPLALRDKPTTSGSTVLIRIARGEKVMLYETQGDWSYVQYGDYVGYCATGYLSHKKPTQYEVDETPLYDPTLTSVEGWTARVNTTDGAELPMLKWCSMEAPNLKNIPNETAVTILEKGDIWCKITYEGVNGYCLTSRMTLIPPAD